MGVESKLNFLYRIFQVQINFYSAVLVVFALMAIMTTVALSKGYSFIPEGPTSEMAQTTREIVTDSFINPERYRQLHKKLINLSRNQKIECWQDVYSMGIDGRLYPMHGILLSFITAPVFALFGETAFMIVPIALVVLTFATIFLSIIQITRSQLCWGDIFLASLGTPILFQGFGYDLLGCALITTAFWLLMVIPWLGGFLLGISLFIRPTYILFLPILMIAGIHGQLKPNSLKTALISTFITVGIFLTYNWILWGNVLTTINQRMPLYVNGEIFFYNPEFSIKTLYSSWYDKLFGPKNGLISYGPVFLLFPWAIIRLRQTQFFQLAIIITMICLANFFTIFSYHCWMYTINGNRFLLPVYALILILVIIATRPKIKNSALS